MDLQYIKTRYSKRKFSAGTVVSNIPKTETEICVAITLQREVARFVFLHTLRSGQKEKKNDSSRVVVEKKKELEASPWPLHSTTRTNLEAIGRAQRNATTDRGKGSPNAVTSYDTSL